MGLYLYYTLYWKIRDWNADKSTDTYRLLCNGKTFSSNQCLLTHVTVGVKISYHVVTKSRNFTLLVLKNIQISSTYWLQCRSCSKRFLEKEVPLKLSIQIFQQWITETDQCQQQARENAQQKKYNNARKRFQNCNDRRLKRPTYVMIKHNWGTWKGQNAR
jgi:hypothetical protein